MRRFICSIENDKPSTHFIPRFLAIAVHLFSSELSPLMLRLRSIAADWILNARVVNSLGDSMGFMLLLSGHLARARLPPQSKAGSPWDCLRAQTAKYDIALAAGLGYDGMSSLWPSRVTFTNCAGPETLKARSTTRE